METSPTHFQGAIAMAKAQFAGDDDMSGMGH